MTGILAKIPSQVGYYFLLSLGKCPFLDFPNSGDPERQVSYDDQGNEPNRVLNPLLYFRNQSCFRNLHHNNLKGFLKPFGIHLLGIQMLLEQSFDFRSIGDHFKVLDTSSQFFF